tara:strand:+ start:1375 stop:1770 length:396 start_codon:yes stop_codon:yes gene_type:complete
MKRKYPDNIVYNPDNDKFDASSKAYPTTVGGQKFEPLCVDRSDSLKADKYFDSRLQEIKSEYTTLVNEYKWTSMIYSASYNFQPIPGEPYHLYENKDNQLFLSLIDPDQWKQIYIGTFKLLNNGKWDKITM